ncbi:MAG TPA: cytochrome c [Candidatus Polarisedimenticolaceae bacterium]|nr:cytochrome c [Candidatus Polarisedimenticolaceae bacterium]
MPRAVRLTAVLLGVLALIPLACIARARVVHSAQPRIHPNQDMDNQGRFESQQANPLFADGRAMRPPVAGTVPQEGFDTDARVATGLDGPDYLHALPLPLTRELLARGHERYGIYCAPCHGLAGYGDGMVARRAGEGWVPPSSFHAEPAASRPVGHLFNTITRGIRTMPAYGPQIPVADRWAIVAYVRALQRSQHARLEDVPAERRAALEAAP